MSAGKHPFAGITLTAAAGIWLADFQWVGWGVSLGLFVVSLALWGCFRRTWALLLVIGLGFGLIHGLQFDRNAARLLAQNLGDQVITVQGTGIVDSMPVETVSPNGKTRSSFQIAASELTFDSGTKIGPLKLLLRWPGAGPRIGDRVQFEGNLFNLTPPRNPGEFDYASWLARQQIFSTISVPLARTAWIVEEGSFWNYRRLAAVSRERLAAIITRDLEDAPVEAGVISAMMLGTSDDTADSTRELFLTTGTLHLFSVSGLHVSMLSAITFFVLVLFRVPRRTALLLTIPAVFGYALITGWSPASVRAALMTAAFVVATLLDRPSLSINTLAVACFLILAANTNQLFATGFQLSFSVVAALVLLCGPITRWLQNLTGPDPFIPRKMLTPLQKSRWHLAGKMSGTLGLTIAAWLGSLPLSAYYFSLLSPVGLLANLAIIPLSFVVLALSVLSIMASVASAGLAMILNNANWGVVKILLGGLGLFAAVPGGSFFVGPHWWQMPDSHRLTVLDLGDGGAAVIEASRGCWLVDCGSEADYQRVVRRYLQMRGINRVEGIFLTHGDSAHVGGLVQFLVDFPEAENYLPKAAADSLVFRKLLPPKSGHWLKAGDSISLDPNIQADVLWPPKKVDSGRADDGCLVLKLTLADETFLLMGDSGFTTEAGLLALPTGDLRAGWIIAGRNRVDPGGSESFFQQTGAKTMVSTAVNFPQAEQIPKPLLEMCQKIPLCLIRMDESGAVKIEVRSGKTVMETFCK